MIGPSPHNSRLYYFGVNSHVVRTTTIAWQRSEKERDCEIFIKYSTVDKQVTKTESETSLKVDVYR